MFFPIFFSLEIKMSFNRYLKKISTCKLKPKGIKYDR